MIINGGYVYYYSIYNDNKQKLKQKLIKYYNYFESITKCYILSMLFILSFQSFHNINIDTFTTSLINQNKLRQFSLI